jgi:hypothetical protein
MVKVINRLDIKDGCYVLSVDICTENGDVVHETLTHKIPILELHASMKLDEETEKLKQHVEEKIKSELFLIITEAIKDDVEKTVKKYCNMEIPKI